MHSYGETVKLGKLADIRYETTKPEIIQPQVLSLIWLASVRL
jgi:hypothetical protein